MNPSSTGSKKLAAFFLACAVCLAAKAQLEPAAGTKTAPTSANPQMAEVADTPGLPRVLLIGDSISMGYTIPVRAKLEGHANVHRPPENCGPTERGLARLDAWLGTNHWDVIHFNFGLHDLKYLDAQGKYTEPEHGKQVAPPAVYEKNLRALVLRLQATGARLIFATTTPVPPGTLGRIAGDERPYNETAVRVMKEMGVEIDDLGGYVQGVQSTLPPLPMPKPAGHPKPRAGDIQLAYNVHFTPEGYDQLAGLVVASINRALPAAPK
jgi:acyl-CoA thioesterase-1